MTRGASVVDRCAVAGLVGILLAVTAAAQAGTGDLRVSLADIYEHAVRDSNGDGLADDVVAKVIVAANPSLADVEAATNISARIAYETTATSLPITMADDEVADLSSIGFPILVGRGNRFVRQLEERGLIKLDALEPGQGLVALVPGFPHGGMSLVVSGPDDAGTAAAALQVAARLPKLWNASGIAMDAIEKQAEDHLQRQGIPESRASVRSLIVDAQRRGIAELHMRVDIANGRQRQALATFEALQDAHANGLEIGVFDFAAVASTVVDVIQASGERFGRVAVSRVGPNWRSLVALQPAPPPLSAEDLAKAADVVAAAPSPAARPPRCLACPAFLLDGMIQGGGGGHFASAAPAAPAKPKYFDLAEAYSINGWFGDRYRDLLPDSTETVVILGGNAREALGAAHIGARLGLESTGITLPLARQQASVLHPRNEQSPILIGRDNALVQALSRAGKVRLDALSRGEGVVEVVPGAFGTGTATVVAGADIEGTDAASRYLSEHLPYVWDIRAGAVTLEDVKTQLSDFLAARTTGGQAAKAIYELDNILREIDGAPDDLEVTLFLEEENKLLERHLERQLVKRAGVSRATVKTRAIRDRQKVIESSLVTEWEGDEFRTRLREGVLPRVGAGDRVEVQAWLSEEPAVRRQLAEQAEADLRAGGAAEAHVRIHSAYKQGFFWLTEQVLPDLRNRGIASVRVRARLAGATSGERIQQHPSRWAKALYPADEVFLREIGLPLDAFRIEQREEPRSVYSVDAFDASGAVVYSSRFDPHLHERAYLEGAPGSAVVQIETGRMEASINGDAVLEERIATDLERFRDAYVETVVPRLIEHVQAASDGRPSMAGAPYFRDLRLEVSISEPDYDFGVPAEHMSAAEALSGELSNVANAALGNIGARSAGRIIPLVRARPGKGAEGIAVVDQNASPNARIDVTYRRAGSAGPETVTRPLEGVESDPRVIRVVARRNDVAAIGLAVVIEDPVKAAIARDALRALSELQKGGVLRGELSYERVSAVVVSFAGDEPGSDVVLAHTGTPDSGRVHQALEAPDGRLVDRGRVIDPPESEEIIRKLSYFPMVSAYRKAHSYEGRDVSVLEITAPSAGALVSMAKLSAYKPTLMLVGRQHGNESSSTTYILDIAESIATDPTYQDIAKQVNVVMLPIMNPDGAALAAEIRKGRPMDVAGAGYLSAIAQDVTVSTKLPESLVDPYLWRRWLPDIYLNAHGATSHELVQPLNNHVSSLAPTYAFRRGWYSLGFRTPRDPRFPEWERAALALRDATAREISADERNRSGNLLDYSRFERWGHRMAPHLEPMELHDDVMMFYNDGSSGEALGFRRLPSPPADEPEENRGARIHDWPMVTMDGGTFEAPDEGALGELLELAIRNGHAAVMGQLKYLRDGRRQIERVEEDAPGDGTSITTIRLRPVRPPRDSEEQ